jgi:hypothetical protein
MVHVTDVRTRGTMIALMHLLSEVVDRLPEHANLRLGVIYALHGLCDHDHFVLHLVALLDVGEELMAVVLVPGTSGGVPHALT